MALSRRSWFGVAIVCAGLAIAGVAAAKLTPTGPANGGFHAVGPSGLDIDGATPDVVVVDDGSYVIVTITLSEIETGLAIRNKHVREDLEVDKFPIARLAVPRSALKLGGGEGETRGSLTVHGQSKIASFKYVATKVGKQIDVDGSATINILDYGIKPRVYAGTTIKPEVTIWAKFSLKE